MNSTQLQSWRQLSPLTMALLVCGLYEARAARERCLGAGGTKANQLAVRLCCWCPLQAIDIITIVRAIG